MQKQPNWNAISSWFLKLIFVYCGHWALYSAYSICYRLRELRTQRRKSIQVYKAVGLTESQYPLTGATSKPGETDFVRFLKPLYSNSEVCALAYCYIFCYYKKEICFQFTNGHQKFDHQRVKCVLNVLHSLCR